MEYFGIPLSELRIDALNWSAERAEHIRTRKERYGPNEFDIEPEWATEAALEPNRIVGLAGGLSQSIEVIGHSEGAQALLKVWLYPASRQDAFGLEPRPAKQTPATEEITKR